MRVSPNSWWVKAGLQWGMSLSSDPQRLNQLFKKHVTKSDHLTPDYLAWKHANVERHVDNATKYGTGIRGAHVLELGTGWFPIVPVGLALAGADRVTTVDRQDLLNLDRIRQAMELHRSLLADGVIDLPGPDAPPVADALARLDEAIGAASEAGATPRSVLAQLGIEALVDDATQLELDRPVDVFVSNDVFEHIPGSVVVEILANYRRLAGTDAIGSHFINLADHYASFDSSITPFHFLQFEGWRWKVVNNELQYHNRLRIDDHRRLQRDGGWTVVAEDNVRGELGDLRSVALAPEFRDRLEDDLLVTSTWLVSRPT